MIFDLMLYMEPLCMTEGLPVKELLHTDLEELYPESFYTTLFHGLRRGCNVCPLMHT
jgi:hypothetical protein